MYENLKVKLLATGLFYDCEWLNKYVNLILNNLHQVKLTYKTQSHHIIPVSLSKLLGKQPDNSVNNMVNLLYPDHILAHYYLMNATNSDEVYADNWLAIKFCLNGYQTDRVSEEWITNNIPLFIMNYEKAKIIGVEKWKNSFGKRCHINNGVIDKRVKIEDLQLWLDSGWVLGRIPDKKYGHNQSGKNNGHYGIYKYTNGVEFISCKPEDVPEGYYRTNPELEHIKKIECIETGIIYKSMREAERYTGVSRDIIGKMCKGTLKRTFSKPKFSFKFAEV